MTRIIYQINPPKQSGEVVPNSLSDTPITGEIVWAASEYFGELAD